MKPVHWSLVAFGLWLISLPIVAALWHTIPTWYQILPVLAFLALMGFLQAAVWLLRKTGH